VSTKRNLVELKETVIGHKWKVTKYTILSGEVRDRTW
jgi:hypothetical protein